MHLAHLERDSDASHEGAALLGRFYLPEDCELFQEAHNSRPSPAPKLPPCCLAPLPANSPQHRHHDSLEDS